MKPTIEEVREYFKDALEVQCVDDGRTRLELTEILESKYFFSTGRNPLSGLTKVYQYAILWNSVDGYATITKTKQNYETRYKDKEVNGMDVIDLCKHWNLNFNEGNVIKYLLRDKGDRIGDLKKIIDYAQRELKHISK